MFSFMECFHNKEILCVSLIQALCDTSQSKQPVKENVATLSQQIVSTIPSAAHVGSETAKMAAKVQSLHMKLKVSWVMLLSD